MPVRSLPRLLAVVAAVSLSSLPLAAQTTPVDTLPSTKAAATTVPSLGAERRDGPIVLDARLDEPAWQKATPATEFLSFV